jgi:predicted DNA-binding transcriptional regulator AlpA
MTKPLSAIGGEMLAAFESEQGDAIIDRIASRIEARIAARLEQSNEVLLNIDEASRLTGRSKAALYQAATRNSIPGVVRHGRLLRFRRADLIAATSLRRGR